MFFLNNNSAGMGFDYPYFGDDSRFDSELIIPGILLRCLGKSFVDLHTMYLNAYGSIETGKSCYH